jgi:hypothetical protein
MAYTRKLDNTEARVLGALMEKEETTPEAYPLSLNALVAACNQKSSREPVMELSIGAVSDALERLRKDVLVWRSEGARVERWDHRLTNRWHLDKPAKAILTLLLLRGPQTPGELRSRSERLATFSSVEEVERALARLSEGTNALVEELARQPGRRENRWRHTMLAHDEPLPRASFGPAARPAPAARLEAAEDAALERRSLERRVAELEECVRALNERIGALEARLANEEVPSGHG